MTNLTPEALKALSEAAIGGTWTVEGSPNTPFYDRRIESNAVPNGVGFADADEAAYIVALVNAHRAGLLVHVDAKGDGSALREALVKIANRPSQMIWGEDSEARAAMNDMEAIADAALKGGPMTDPITTAALLPCPFCGETDIHIYEGDDVRPHENWARCMGCGAGTDRGFHHQVVAAWNRRALPIARPVAGAEMVEKVARALCEGAIGGRCACSGEFSCADEYPGRQARAALAAMGYEVRK